jgi:hypothetical protein
MPFTQRKSEIRKKRFDFTGHFEDGETFTLETTIRPTTNPLFRVTLETISGMLVTQTLTGGIINKTYTVRNKATGNTSGLVKILSARITITED